MRHTRREIRKGRAEFWSQFRALAAAPYLIKAAFRRKTPDAVFRPQCGFAGSACCVIVSHHSKQDGRVSGGEWKDYFGEITGTILRPFPLQLPAASATLRRPLPCLQNPGVWGNAPAVAKPSPPPAVEQSENLRSQRPENPTTTRTITHNHPISKW